MCAREGIERTQKKLHFFHSFLYHQSGTVRVRSPLETEARNRNSSSRAFTKICRNTRVDSHSHAHALKTFTSSRPRKKKRERERERGTFHSRARSFLSRREVEFPPLYISRVLKIGTLLACLPFLIKNPPRRTQVTQRRKNASTNTHIFKTRMAKYYPDIAKGAKGTRSFKPVLFYYFVPCFCSLFCANKSAISLLLRRGSRRGVSPFFLSSFSSNKKQIYSPALCPTKTNSPWTRNQSPAGYVFYPRLSFLSDLERDSRLSLRSNHHRTRDRNIERFLLRCLSVEKALMRKNEQNERFLTRALFLSLSTCDEHTHAHT